MPKPKSKRACPEPGASRSRRGGRRPGAGAPRGNLNALKHGRRSQQLAQIGALLAADPELQLTLLDLGRRHLDRQMKAQEVAALWLTRLLEHAEKIARGESSRGPFSHLLNDGQSKSRRRTRPRTNTKRPNETRKAHSNNQTRNEDPEINHSANTKKAPISHD